MGSKGSVEPSPFNSKTEAEPAVGQGADFARQELAAAGAFAAVLLGQRGDADGRELVDVAIHPAGQAHAQGAGGNGWSV